MPNDLPTTGPLATFLPADETGGAPIPVLSTSAGIGQGPQNEVVLDDDTVSTRHARLDFEAGGWRITDLDSRNGTFVDGVRLAAGIPTPLPENAAVAFGAYRLTFVPDANADPDAVPASRAHEAAVPLAERKALRLPLWLLVLLILMVALLVTLFVLFGGDPRTVEPVADPATALLADLLPAAA